jgi:hypothetical protein
MPPRKPVIHHLEWTHPLTGRRARLRITVTANYLQQGSTHLEIRSLRPRNTPHPLSPTGYRSHFIDAAELRATGGPVRFVRAWIEREATSPQFLREDLARRQGNLFEWAEAHAATVAVPKMARRPSAKSARRPARTPHRRPT